MSENVNIIIRHLTYDDLLIIASELYVIFVFCLKLTFLIVFAIFKYKKGKTIIFDIFIIMCMFFAFVYYVYFLSIPAIKVVIEASHRYNDFMYHNRLKIYCIDSYLAELPNLIRTPEVIESIIIKVSEPYARHCDLLHSLLKYTYDSYHFSFESINDEIVSNCYDNVIASKSVEILAKVEQCLIEREYNVGMYLLNTKNLAIIERDENIELRQERLNLAFAGARLAPHAFFIGFFFYWLLFLWTFYDIFIGKRFSWKETFLNLSVLFVVPIISLNFPGNSYLLYYIFLPFYTIPPDTWFIYSIVSFMVMVILLSIIYTILAASLVAIGLKRHYFKR